MGYSYDTNNIFARILRGEIPCSKVHETDHALAFNDIAPQAPHHVLVIPKGSYVNFDDFAANASDVEIVDYNRAIAQTIAKLNAAPATGGMGYRLIANTGEAGVQDVPHLHVHILGGRVLGRMLPKAD